MSIAFPNLALLALTAALAIPPLIHLLSRRRHEVVDWGAMQFLSASPRRRRRFMIEEVLLLALRWLLIAALFLAFADPKVSGPLIADWKRPPRDTVLILDGSYSMQSSDGAVPSPWEAARHWCRARLAEASTDDRVAVLVASQPPEWLTERWHGDPEALRDVLANLPPPTGNADWPRAVADAWDFLRQTGRAARRELVLLTDQRRFGWTDPATLHQWRALARRFQHERDAAKGDAAFVAPTLYLPNLGDRVDGPNLWLGPLQAPRTLVGLGQRLRLTTELHWTKQTPAAPAPTVRAMLADEVRRLTLPAKLEGATGRLRLSFEHRFTTLGVHLVGVVVEPPPGHDVLPA
ncbi:MAG: BatA domain-containing protein, partial [Gemmataceae bacterium]|nr:BatA domain-containing protein [Gemmataceae bacterium]